METVKIACYCKDCEHCVKERAVRKSGEVFYEYLCYWWDYEEYFGANAVEPYDFCSHAELAK